MGAVTMTNIPPTDADYLPLRIMRDQLRIGDVAYDIRNPQRAPGIVSAEVRHSASGGPWERLTVTLSRGADGHHGDMSIGSVPYLVRRWFRTDHGASAEAGPVSDDEFEDFAPRLGSKVGAG